MLDIHSHILPDVDDGSESVEESIALLEMMKKQGITDVIATPHLYPHEDSLIDFLENSNNAYNTLMEAIKGKDLPNIYLGCEILYFEGMGHSQSLGNLCLNKSNYLLIELTDECINESLMANLLNLVENTQIIPIIAHVERYFGSRNYRKFLKFLQKEEIMVQINASSFGENIFDRAIHKIFKYGIKAVVATDTHSLEERPPKMTEALKILRNKYGNSVANEVINNINEIAENINISGVTV